MRILFLTSRLPYPPHRGDKLKIFNLMSRLARRHEVYLLTFVEDMRETEQAGALRSFCTDVRIVHLPFWKSYLNCFLRAGSKQPYQVLYYRSRSMANALSEYVRAVQPDVIHTHLIRMAQYTFNSVAVPRVLDLTDAVSLYLQRFMRSERRALLRWALKNELARIMSYEPVIRQFDAALVCSETDRDFLINRIPDANISILPNGVDTGLFRPMTEVNEMPQRVIFTGNMSYFPNVDGARTLVKDIWPRVRKAVPGATLYIVGQNPPKSIRALQSDDVTVTGFVSDIQVEYAKSAIAVSPIRFGAGTLNKVLEPMAMGKAVVTTSLGISDLGLDNNRSVLIADDPKEFADAIIRLMNDTELRMKIGASARDHIRSTFNWDTIVMTLERIYKAITA